jgi:hypothetical protein
LAQAEEGLLHVMGVLRERDEVREEFEQSTRAGSDRRNGDGMRVELLRAESRPKIWIGMFPFGMPSQVPTTGGLAEA